MEAAGHLFISSSAWHFHGLICFNPRESCRRNPFLLTLIKIIFCRAGSNGQNVTCVMRCFLVCSHNSTSCSFICFLVSHRGHINQELLLVAPWLHTCVGPNENLWSGGDNACIFLILPNNMLKYGIRENASIAAVRPLCDVNTPPPPTFNLLSDLAAAFRHPDTKFNAFFRVSPHC